MFDNPFHNPSCVRNPFTLGSMGFQVYCCSVFLLRRVMLMPQSCTSFLPKRMAEKGINISKLQPSVGNYGTALPDRIPAKIFRFSVHARRVHFRIPLFAKRCYKIFKTIQLIIVRIENDSNVIIGAKAIPVPLVRWQCCLLFVHGNNHPRKCLRCCT